MLSSPSNLPIGLVLNINVKEDFLVETRPADPCSFINLHRLSIDLPVNPTAAACHSSTHLQEVLTMDNDFESKLAVSASCPLLMRLSMTWNFHSSV